MDKPFSDSDFHLSTYRAADDSEDESEGDEDSASETVKEEGGEENTEDEQVETPESEEPEVEIPLEQLPDELSESIENHIEIFSDSGVTIIGLGQVDIDDEADLDELEQNEEASLKLEEVNVVEMFCEVGEVRFVYSFFPNRSYNGIEIQYNVLQELFLLSGVDALDDLDDMQRMQAVNMLEEILSQKDLGAVLRSNRTIERSDLVAWINILRSQNADFIHVLDYTPEGEVVGSRLEKRIYLPDEQRDKEKRLHKAVQKMTNISRSYSGLLGLAYLENGVRIPDSIAEKVRAAVSEKDWDAYDPVKEGKHIRGYQ